MPFLEGFEVLIEVRRHLLHLEEIVEFRKQVLLAVLSFQGLVVEVQNLLHSEGGDLVVERQETGSQQADILFVICPGPGIVRLGSRNHVFQALCFRCQGSEV